MGLFCMGQRGSRHLNRGVVWANMLSHQETGDKELFYCEAKIRRSDCLTRHTLFIAHFESHVIRDLAWGVESVGLYACALSNALHLFF